MCQCNSCALKQGASRVLWFHINLIALTCMLRCYMNKVSTCLNIEGFDQHLLTSLCFVNNMQICHLKVCSDWTWNKVNEKRLNRCKLARGGSNVGEDAFMSFENARLFGENKQWLHIPAIKLVWTIQGGYKAAHPHVSTYSSRFL